MVLSSEIAVVGAGPAGLRTAMLLQEAGYEVHVFEAQARVGGRLLTVQTDRGFYDAGGEWIDADHARIMQILKSFDQEPVESTSTEGLTYFDGKILPESELSDLLKPELEMFYEKADLIALDLESPPWVNGIYANYDHETLGDFIKKCHLKPLAAKYLRSVLISDEGEELDRIGLLGWLTGYRQYLERSGDEMSAFRFPKGAQGFCEDMAATLKNPVKLNSEIISFDQNPIFIELELQGGAERFDRVVFAIPPQSLCKINGFSGLSNTKQVANEETYLGRTIKIALRFKTKFWLDLGFSGRLLTDKHIQQCWDGSRGDEAVLLAYINGSEAEYSLGNRDLFKTFLDEIEPVFPGAAEQFLDGEVYNWIGNQWAGGGFSYPGTGHVLDRWQPIIQSEMRLHFAGEHTAEAWGFIEGALESAERVVREILGKSE